MKLSDLRSLVPIDSFKGEYAFLSNFFVCNIEFEGRKYKTVEHYYQAHKATTLGEHEWVRGAKTAGEAKRRGRKIFINNRWDSIKIDVMRCGLQMKFADDRLAEKLIATQNAPLIEGNTWHDNFWGDCSCAKCTNIVGANILGSLLMEMRILLQTRSKE